VKSTAQSAARVFAGDLEGVGQKGIM